MMKKIIKVFIMFLFIVATYNVVSKAAISATSKTVNSGENVSILVTSDVQVSAYTVKVTGYNGLTFVTSSGGAGAGSTSISDAKATGGITNLATFKFKAPSIEKDQTFQVTFSATGMGDINLNPVPNSICTANITVKGKNQSTGETNPPTQEKPSTPVTTEKSSVATLSNLGINGQYDFTGFRSSKTSYSVTVPNEVESVEIYAKKGQSGQKITGTGVKQLKEGANAVNVVVTAEDGKTTKTYTINIERKAAEETPETTAENPDETEKQEIVGLTELKIGGLELTPEFKTDVYKYSVELKEDKDKIDLTTVATVENAEIEITGNENLKDGENIITIIVKAKDTDETTTYQINVNKVLPNTNTVEATVNNVENNNTKMIVLGACLAIILLIIIIVIIIIRKRRNINDGEEYYYSELYNDDEKKEEKEEIEQDNQVNMQDETEYEEEYEEEQKKKRHAKGKRFK